MILSTKIKMMIDLSRVVPRVLMAVLVGIAFILLVQFELRHRKNKKDEEVSDDSIFTVLSHKLESVFKLDGEVNSTIGRKKRSVFTNSEIFFEKSDIPDVRNLELSSPDNINSSDKGLTNIMLNESYVQSEKVPDKIRTIFIRKKYLSMNDTGVNETQSLNSFSLRECFNSWGVVILISLTSIISFLLGSFCCLGKQLLWSRKHFSPNKWWMSRNEELWNFTSLVRQKSKSLISESQSTVTDDSVVPLLPSDASNCTSEPTQKPSLFNTETLSVIITCPQSTVSSPFSTASSYIKSPIPIHNLLFSKFPMLNNESYFVKPSGQIISTPVMKSSSLTVASEFVRSSE
ncbi:uncharacterized protein LOC143237363 [Tachypleus tridentatus]|uniref:uncharacterized protein LOC143237363 n=1 Tax=Tachypleus tridentatus TaxID=6853 RepID=UPI003FD03B85